VLVGGDPDGRLLLDGRHLGNPTRRFAPIRVRGKKPHRFALVLEALARGEEARLSYSDVRKLNGWLGETENGRQLFRVEGDTTDPADKEKRPVRVIAAPGVSASVSLAPPPDFKPL